MTEIEIVEQPVNVTISDVSADVTASPTVVTVDVVQQNALVTIASALPVIEIAALGARGESGMEPKYTLRYDEVSASVSYVGEAAVGSLETAAAWRIKRITDTGDITIEWAGGSAAFDKRWDEHLILTYS